MISSEIAKDTQLTDKQRVLKEGNLPKVEYQGEVDAPLVPPKAPGEQDQEPSKEDVEAAEEEVFDIDEVPKNVSLVDEEDARKKKREQEEELLRKIQEE